MKAPMTKLMLAAAAATLLCLGVRAGTTLDDGLVAYYKFDGDIADSSGNGKVFSASEGIGERSWKMKRSKLSKRASTRWDELMAVR